MNRFLKDPLYILAFSILIFKINAQLPGNWPEVDKPPPPVPSWTALVNMDNVPTAPITKGEGDCLLNDEFCNWSCTECARDDTIVTCPNKGDWGLSFDDGPTEYTNALLDYLESKNVTLTFFVVGSRVIENPEILEKAVKNGHQIGVHTWSHPFLTTRTNEEIIAEIKWTEVAIKDAVGITPKYMRPPYGNYDDRVRGIITQLGYKAVIWDKDTSDWMSGVKGVTYNLEWIEGNFSKWVTEPSNTGHISLEHDLYEQTAARATYVVPIVQNAGFAIKPVAACFNDSHPYVEDVSLTPSTPTTSNTTITSTASQTIGNTPVDTSNIESPIVVVTSTPSIPSSSNAIFFTNKNSNLLLFVLLIIGSFIII